jgi:hypothetical protein
MNRVSIRLDRAYTAFHHFRAQADTEYLDSGRPLANHRRDYVRSRYHFVSRQPVIKPKTAKNVHFWQSLLPIMA